MRLQLLTTVIGLQNEDHDTGVCTITIIDIFSVVCYPRSSLLASYGCQPATCSLSDTTVLATPSVSTQGDMIDLTVRHVSQTRSCHMWATVMQTGYRSKTMNWCRAARTWVRTYGERYFMLVNLNSLGAEGGISPSLSANISKPPEDGDTKSELPANEYLHLFRSKLKQTRSILK